MIMVKSTNIKNILLGKIFEILDENEFVTIKIDAKTVQSIVKSSDKF